MYSRTLWTLSNAGPAKYTKGLKAEKTLNFDKGLEVQEQEQ